MGRTGCLVWVALGLLVLAFIWKSLQFYILGPAEVKAALNDAYDQVRVMRATPDVRRIAFFDAWRAVQDSTDSPRVRRCTRPAFEGDSVYVQYSDTFHLPAIPDSLTVKNFKIYRLFV